MAEYKEILAEEPVRRLTIAQFSDGTYSAFLPLDGEVGVGLSRGDLDGALVFAREQLSKD